MFFLNTAEGTRKAVIFLSQTGPKSRHKIFSPAVICTTNFRGIINNDPGNNRRTAKAELNGPVRVSDGREEQAITNRKARG